MDTGDSYGYLDVNAAVLMSVGYLNARMEPRRIYRITLDFGQCDAQNTV